jgi:hypothetical protein
VTTNGLPLLTGRVVSTPRRPSAAAAQAGSSPHAGPPWLGNNPYNFDELPLSHFHNFLFFFVQFAIHDFSSSK